MLDETTQRENMESPRGEEEALRLLGGELKIQTWLQPSALSQSPATPALLVAEEVVPGLSKPLTISPLAASMMWTDYIHGPVWYQENKKWLLC